MDTESVNMRSDDSTSRTKWGDGHHGVVNMTWAPRSCTAVPQLGEPDP